MSSGSAPRSSWAAIPPRPGCTPDPVAACKTLCATPSLPYAAGPNRVTLRSERSPRDDVLSALAPLGPARANSLSALRQVFRILKARQVVFVNPTTRISVSAPNKNIPLPVDLAIVRATLRSDDPTVAALAALVAFHALTSAQLRALRLTDAHDGRLFIDERVIVLAEPVRQRLSAYLDHRSRRWPATANPYLFLHYRNALRTKPVANADWISVRLGGFAQAMREDRILDELLATGGDIRRLCDLFGLSISGAQRYLGALSHPELDPPAV